MINSNKKYIKRISFSLLLLISLIFTSKSIKKKDFHPFNIQFDYSNLKGGIEGDFKKILLEEIEMGGEFLSQIIYNNNHRDSFTFTQDTLKYCYDKRISFEITKYKYDNTELLIIPLYADKEKRSIFQGYICKQHNLKLTYLAILEISSNYANKLIKKDRDLLRLKLLHSLTNIIGFDTSLLNKETLSNSYFIVPKYVTDNFWYSQSIKKYYNFTNINMPKIRVIDEIRSSYKKYWSEEIMVPDYMNEKIN